MYRITIEVSGTDAKGFAHITNLDKVNIRNEKTGDSSLSIDDEFTASASYITEGKVKEIAAQGMVHSNEKASVRIDVYKRQQGNEMSFALQSYNNQLKVSTAKDAVENSNLFVIDKNMNTYSIVIRRNETSVFTYNLSLIHICNTRENTENEKRSIL